MAQLIVRNLEDTVVRALKEAAGRHGRSAEEEHREILRNALLVAPPEERRAVLLDMPDVGDQTRKEIHYNMGLMYQEMGQLQNARTQARRALQFDANFGPAYMLIGDVYVTAVQNQGSLERRDRAVYWLALDYYERARDVDPSVASRANANIRTYRAYMPTGEDIFYELDWTVGEVFSINYGPYSWINETTRVRRPYSGS
jgi:plasmid stability protein